MLDDIPFVAIGDEELGEPLGAVTHCPHCHNEHPVTQSDPPTLQFVKCPENDHSYLVGINGKAWKK